MTKNGQPFLEGASTRQYMQLYNSDSSTLDMWINSQYGSWILPYKCNLNDAIIDYRIKMLGSFILNDYYFAELFKTMSYEYDPIANYDRKEEWTDTRTPNLTTEDKGNFTNQPYQDVDIASENVYAYNNNSSPVPQLKNELNRQYGLRSGSDGNKRTETGQETNVHKGSLSGNIGVTTTQQMIDAQRNIVDIAFIKVVIRRLVEECFIQETKGL